MIRVAVALLAAIVVSACGSASSSSSAAAAAPSASGLTSAAVAAPSDEPASSTEATMTGSPAPSGAFTLTSSAFSPNGPIPRHFGCDGDAVSPPLAWSGTPAGAAELELLVDDPDARGFVHWVAAGIAPSTASIAEGATGSGAIPVEGKNSRGQTGWTAPCPPSGTHHYVFTLYAVSKPLGLRTGVTADELRAAVKDVTVGTARLTGTYRKGG